MTTSSKKSKTGTSAKGSAPIGDSLTTAPLSDIAAAAQKTANDLTSAPHPFGGAEIGAIEIDTAEEAPHVQIPGGALPPAVGGELLEPASDAEIEKAIQATKPTGPRLTPAHIQAAIVDEAYTLLEGTTTTICYLTLRNGYVVTGESACISPENFDQKIGCEVAYKQAEGKVWALEGYLLKEFLANAKGKSDLNPIFETAKVVHAAVEALHASTNDGGGMGALSECDDAHQMAVVDMVSAILNGTELPDPRARGSVEMMVARAVVKAIHE